MDILLRRLSHFQPGEDMFTKKLFNSNYLVSLVLVLFGISATQSYAQYSRISEWQARFQIDNANHTLPYRLHLPKNFNPSNQYPLLLVLHGATELGNNNTSQLDWVGNHLWGEESVQDTFPCFVAIPQCPSSVSYGWAGQDWTQVMHTQLAQPTWAMQSAIDMVDSLCKEFPINKSRLYVTGVSMGGFGTWESITRWPEKFAAAIPVAGGGDTTKVSRILNLPIHCLHGGSDGLVPTANTRNMYAAITHAGGALCKYTEIAGGGHDGGTFMNAYTATEIRWLFSQTKSTTHASSAIAHSGQSYHTRTAYPVFYKNSILVTSLKSNGTVKQLYSATGKLIIRK
jgi:predicted peptidase